MNRLSIVVISRNEARNIARCIESVLAAAALVPETDVLLVDSASPDETCAIAQRYPISILQLRPNWRLTAAAGRYIGTLNTRSEYVLFVDGDMALEPEWITAGLGFMHTHPEAAAVSGDMDEVYVDGGNQVIGALTRRYRIAMPSPVRALGGVGLYRRSVLDQFGTFNPFVPLREEAELALRLRHHGYRLYRIPDRISIHYSPPRNTLQELERRRRAGYYAGFGRALYYAACNHLGWQFLREQGMDYVYFSLYLLAGFASLMLSVITGAWQGLGLWAGLTFLLLGGYGVRKKSLRTAGLGYLTRSLMVYGAVAGMLSALRDPPQYPTDALVIQTLPEHTTSLSRTSTESGDTAHVDKPPIPQHGAAGYGRLSV